MKKFLLLIITILTFNNSFSQVNIDSIINYTLYYRGLTRDDITIPINFDKDKSPTNDSKLILPLVKEMMQNPMKSFGFMDSISEFLNLNLNDLIIRFYSLDGLNNNLTSNQFYLQKKNKTFDELIEMISDSFEIIKEKNRILKKKFSKEEIDFLNKNLMSIIQETDDEDNSNSDIFKFNRSRDTSIAISRKAMNILADDKRFEKNMMYSDFVFVNELYNIVISNAEKFQSHGTEQYNDAHLQGDFLYYSEEKNLRIAVGGTGKNIYTGHFDLIIDYGGDDVYSIDRETNDLFKNNFSCIIDLAGNDYYTTNSNYSLAGAAFSSGFIFDREGDDVYKGKNVTLGSAICGLGVLYDEKGNDTYQANQFSIGAASFGVGLLFDKEGNDVYFANSYSQGFGMTEGVGAIVDNKGNDNYLINASSVDIGRYEDHFISMSQGYGLGVRPYYAGGIGLIIEGEGNDFYSTDIFGQGGGYWYALGCIVDKSGHDKYNSYQYAQGAGIHLAVGLLKDYDGWDFYTSDGVSQGCGHDFGFGLLDDVKGNDNYSAYSLSQGAGNANGIGMLIDESGRDGYLNKEPGNTLGYGNSRREYGSIGFFLDASGDDFYSSQMDSVISNTSTWGVMNDFYLKDIPSQASGNNFKIPLDSNKNYSLEDYFIMAKTIEPRFSAWQEYGFRKLVEDSIRTSEYILKYLDTDDHREGLVLRNLAFRIGFTIGNYLTDKLRLYNHSMNPAALFNEQQVAYICYLFGETRNPVGKEELLNLTYNSNIRIKSIAVNALGKINVDSSDTDFRKKAAFRLCELADEDSQYKLYKKDIAYAFKNYFNFDNIATLILMMKENFFGARFLASEDLRVYGKDYSSFITDDLINTISKNKIWLHAFLYSIIEMSEEKFKYIFNRVLNSTPNDEVIRLKYIDLLNKRSQRSSDKEFKDWADALILKFKSENILKVN